MPDFTDAEKLFLLFEYPQGDRGKFGGMVSRCLCPTAKNGTPTPHYWAMSYSWQSCVCQNLIHYFGSIKYVASPVLSHSINSRQRQDVLEEVWHARFALAVGRCFGLMRIVAQVSGNFVGGVLEF